MKEINVNGQIVQLNAATSAKLTPRLVRQALRLAYGHTNVTATVTDGESGYMVTPSSCRRMTAEQEYDAGID